MYLGTRYGIDIYRELSGYQGTIGKYSKTTRSVGAIYDYFGPYLNIEGELLRIGETLGRGGFGKVFKVYDIDNRVGAIKAVLISDKSHPLKTQLGLGGLYVVDKEEAHEEVDIQKSLESEFIGEIYGDYDDGSIYWILMPFYPNSLRSKIPTSEREAKYLAREIAIALHQMITKRFSHRDLKPENIMIDDEQIKIIDFGMATMNCVSDNDFGGTITYMAPEVLLKKSTNQCKVDIWALGVILYELITGDLPANPVRGREKDLKQLRNRIEKIEKRNIDRKIKDILIQEIRKQINRIEINNLTRQIETLNIPADPKLRRVSSKTVNLIRDMLSINPEDRPSPAQIVARLS